VAGQDLQIHSGPMPGRVVPVTGGTGGIGMQAGPAVSAVLLYRLATYWLPGWLCWRSLQHRGYL
jgi:hypothetical protein